MAMISVSATVIQELHVRFDVSKLVCDPYTVCYTGTNVSEEHNASIFRVDN
jgi:hypothetical protein